MLDKKYNENYKVEGKDYNGKTFIECKCHCITDAVKVYNSFSAWNKYILDNTTGEVIVYSDVEKSFSALEVK